MSSPAVRHLSRLLGDPPGTVAAVRELIARVRAEPSVVVQGLVEEALASVLALRYCNKSLFF